MSTCIFPGRFQPFHTGHLMVVQGMANACGNVSIVICCDPDGSSGEGLFTTEEVREMISAALLEAEIMDANIIVLKDCPDDDEWVDRILDAAGNPSDAKVWTGKPEVKALFEAQGIPVQNISEVPGHDTDEIRMMVEEGNTEWRKKMPAGAMDVVDKKMRP